MPTLRAWTDYHPHYRAPQMRALAGWIAAGDSGSVVGMGGAGKSNLLGFLANRPDVLAGYLPEGQRAMAVLIDLNSLPATDLATIYRLFLRSFHQARGRLDAPLAAEIERVFAEQLAERDPFVVQTALLDWLEQLTESGLHVALVIDRFDRFSERATPELTDTLRSLRDAFKGRLCFLAGMRQPTAYLPDPSVLGELQELLDTRICWVGSMDDADARRMIDEEMASAEPRPSEAQREALIEVTGGYPALLKAGCHWWLDSGSSLPHVDWADALRQLPGIRARMTETWEGLTQTEQAALGTLASSSSDSGGSAGAADGANRVPPEHEQALARLLDKGLITNEKRQGSQGSEGLKIRGTLLELRAGGKAGRRGGQIWFDEATGEIYLGRQALSKLTNLQREALHYLLERPRALVPKTELIEGVWPDDVVADGVMDDALYQVVRGIRRRIEPEPGKPRYLVTWRGRPEGGYQLFPEGRPS